MGSGMGKGGEHPTSNAEHPTSNVGMRDFLRKRGDASPTPREWWMLLFPLFLRRERLEAMADVHVEEERCSQREETEQYPACLVTKKERFRQSHQHKKEKVDAHGERQSPAFHIQRKHCDEVQEKD